MVLFEVSVNNALIVLDTFMVLAIWGKYIWKVNLVRYSYSWPQKRPPLVRVEKPKWFSWLELSSRTCKFYRERRQHSGTNRGITEACHNYSAQDYGSFQEMSLIRNQLIFELIKGRRPIIGPDQNLEEIVT